jgi:general secretion pathway protein G
MRSCGNRGFTLIELLLVLFLVALLASLVGPALTSGIQRSRESALKEDLHVVRKALDDYYADNGSYPAELQVLVDKRYLRNVPVDPFTDRYDSWTIDRDDSKDHDEGKQAGIRDIHSGSDGQGRDGTAYKDW